MFCKKDFFDHSNSSFTALVSESIDCPMQRENCSTLNETSTSDHIFFSLFSYPHISILLLHHDHFRVRCHNQLYRDISKIDIYCTFVEDRKQETLLKKTERFREQRIITQVYKINSVDNFHRGRSFGCSAGSANLLADTRTDNRFGYCVVHVVPYPFYVVALVHSSAGYSPLCPDTLA